MCTTHLDLTTLMVSTNDQAHYGSAPNTSLRNQTWVGATSLPHFHHPNYPLMNINMDKEKKKNIHDEDTNPLRDMMGIVIAYRNFTVNLVKSMKRIKARFVIF
jgi:hypothetical protein